MHPIVQQLADLVTQHHWQAAFASALDDVARQEIPALAGVRSFADYLDYIDKLVEWAPREHGDSLLVHDKLVEFYFVLDQPALRALQSPVVPGQSDKPLTPLSIWIVGFARAWGSYLDGTDSARHVESFKTNPAFRWDDYMPPPSGYLTFNQFFARHVKPGRRPVASPDSADQLVSPADATYIGQWPVAPDSSIKAKGMRWSIEELLKGSGFAGRFAGGVFTHVGLQTFDYHRFHSPVSGKILESRIVRGQSFMDVEVADARPAGEDGTGEGEGKSLKAVEGTGYQFLQTRGLVIMDSPIGLVACLPIGMAQVSSVVLTAEVGAELRKGEELGYFQFGGSDFVMVFESRARVVIDLQSQQRLLQGECFATATAA